MHNRTEFDLVALDWVSGIWSLLLAKGQKLIEGEKCGREGERETTELRTVKGEESRSLQLV